MAVPDRLDVPDPLTEPDGADSDWDVLHEGDPLRETDTVGWWVSLRVAVPVLLPVPVPVLDPVALPVLVPLPVPVLVPPPPQIQ